MRILLFSEVTLFKYNVSTLLSPIVDIQRFRKRLSEKVHSSISKVVVGGFEFTVLQRNLKDWHERPWTCVCEC